MFTMLIASIAIGLAVDDTIHFMHNFRRYFEQTGDVREAVRETLRTAGRAMLITSIVLALGFLIFTFSAMNHLTNFGLLTGMAVLLAMISNFVMAPALMAVLHRQPRAQRSGQLVREWILAKTSPAFFPPCPERSRDDRR
jgi:predicted RND superfamily exporter protein